MKKILALLVLSMMFGGCDSSTKKIDSEPVVNEPITATPTPEPIVPEVIPEPIEPEPKCEPIGEVKEFVPFTHVLGMPYIQEDYDAIAAQETLYIGDCRSYEGKVYKSLRNWNVYPDEFNTQGNPFHIFTDQAFVGGEYFRQHPVETTCTQRFTFTAISDVNDKQVWAKGGYNADVNPTENCEDFLTWATYDIYGQLATSLYGAIALGSWRFKIDEVIYYGYRRDYEIIPTPDSVEDLDFWELVE